MDIKRIKDLSELELQHSATSFTEISHITPGANEDTYLEYILEIISSYKPMNDGPNRIHSTLAIFEKKSKVMKFHEVYLDTLTPEQIKEAEVNVQNKFDTYLKMQDTSNAN